MKAFFKFMQGVYSSGSPESSKRFFGSIGWLNVIIIIYIWRHDLTETLLYVSAALVGFETILESIKLFKKKDENKPE